MTLKEKAGYRRRAAALAAAFLLLCGCTGNDAGQTSMRSISEHYETVNGFTARVKILSDLGDSTLEYTADFEYNKEDSDKMTLVTPESLSGIQISIAGQDVSQLTIQYADTVLDTGMSPRPGMTPADAVPALLYDLRVSEPAEVWEESVGGVPMTVARYESEDEQGRVSRQVWLTRDSLRPSCAELYADGERVLQLFFSDYSES